MRSSLAGALLLGSLGLHSFAASTAGSPRGNLPTLTTIRQVHLLSAEQAIRRYPVHIKNAVIAYYDPYLNHPRRPVIMVTDRTASIYIGIAGETTLPLRAGTRLDVTGESGPGDFAPSIDHAEIRVLGQDGVLPPAPKETLTHLLTGSEDAQWCEMEGVIKSVDVSGNNITLKLALTDGEMAATTVKEPGADYAKLIDAKVKIKGIAGSLFNRHNQIFGVQLLFPSLSTLTVEGAPPPSPFDLPLTPLWSLMTYAPKNILPHRVHVRGIVTLFWPGRLLCLQDGAQALCAATAQTASLALGGRVDVAGFPMIGNVTPTLGDATYRALPDQVTPVPGSLIDGDAALSQEHDAQLVQIEGRLIAHDRASLDPAIVVSSGKFNFPVVLADSEDARALRKLEEGSLLRITGIYSIQTDSRVFTRHDGYPVAKYFQVMLRSSSDVVVVRRPSWWTPKHTLYVLAFALAITLAVLCWVVLLRNRVEEQARLLRHQATHDGLTGLWNRKAVLDLLQREFEIAARAHSSIGIVMLDADHFKEVNDTYGHLAGDAVLQELARRIQLTLRSYDLTGRYGGEEFLIVVPGCTAQQILLCAERVRAMVADSPIKAEGSNLNVTISAGTAILDPLLNTQRDALAAADRALYEAKHAGRNRVVSGATEYNRVERAQATTVRVAS